MKLPNAEYARVERKKIVDYLLNPSHPDGWSKAEFFSAFGFRPDNWQVLADALRSHGQTRPVTRAVESAHGTRYTVEGQIETPQGRRPRVRTVWIVERGGRAPRLITAHPA
ncbi:MAG: hypothetical protein FJ272_04140 [Planctomycetes bacterium]|nr:hypothetical protein [Planctomycetota bacterium]MBM4083959.1 hypothetical protein [Planctomycetota bacterium]